MCLPATKKIQQQQQQHTVKTMQSSSPSPSSPPSPALVQSSHSAFQTYTKKSPHAKRSIRFNETVTIHPIRQQSTTMPAEMKSQLYYSKEERDGFQLEVKAIREGLFDCYRIQQQQQASTDTTTTLTPQHILLPLASAPALRGLELHIHPLRIRNKITACKAFLKYQQHICSSQHRQNALGMACHSSFGMSTRQRDDCLAEAYGKLSEWSRMVALETGRLDSLRAYGMNDEERSEVLPRSLTPTQEPVEISSFPSLKKRRVSTTVEDEVSLKNKRARYC